MKLEYDSAAAEDPFLPIDRIKRIPIDISYQISGQYAEMLAELYQSKRGGQGMENFIYIYIDETPEWCTASITPVILKVLPKPYWVSKNASIDIRVTENAPASAEGVLKVRLEAKPMGTIRAGTFFAEIPFIPGYLPILDIKTERTTKLIGPYDTAYFGIEVENLGNAKTQIICNALNVPEGWIIEVDTNVVIGAKTSGDNTKKTIYLSIKPPYGFGYHNEREVINISITPSYFNDPSLKGEEYLLSFIVQNRGFSTPGFEAGLVVVGLIYVGFILRIRKRYPSNKKGEEDI